MRYSGFKVFAEGLGGNKGWKPAWREPEPRPDYDVIIIGGGGHGLSTAYYLAKNHGITNVAVLEKGYLGGGNVGRNTTIVRANYFLPGNQEFYSHSLKLWEGLEGELNYNVMHSQRGLINLFHSDGQRDAFARRGNAMINQGDDAELLDREGVRRHLPYLDFEQTRFPIYGGLLHRRGGTARHDAVAWGYARGADRRGVDLIQNCEVTGIDIENGRVTGVQTTRGAIRAKKVGIVVAGRSGQVAAMAGMRLPIDLGEVVVDRGDGLISRHVFVAHATAGRGRRRWSSRTVVAMNGTHLAGADLGPRAHPNDGLLDISDGRVPASQVRAAGRRERTGSHVPHPGILERRTAAYEVLDERELPIRVDGRLIGAATHFELRCLPDALVIVV